MQKREEGSCVISGFHCQIEKDVLYYLLKGKQPIIVVVARGLKEKIETRLQGRIKEGRLLIITSFEKTVKRITEQTAATRNKLMIEIAVSVMIGFASPDGELEKMLKGIEKPIIKI